MIHTKTLTGISLVLALMIAIAGCEAEKSGIRGTSSSATSTGGGLSSAFRDSLPKIVLGGKVEFRKDEGVELYSLKPKDDGTACKFYDASGKELCKFSLSDGKLKAKSADDQPLFELKPKDQKLMIKDATGEKELFKFKLKGDTIDFYLPGDKRVHRIKKKDYGWRLEDNAEKTLFRAKSKDGKMVLRDLDDKTVLYSNDIPSPLGLIFFKIDSLSLEQQMACAILFLDK